MMLLFNFGLHSIMHNSTEAETKKLQREELDNRREREKQATLNIDRTLCAKFQKKKNCRFFVREINFGVTKTVKMTRQSFFMLIV